MSDLSFRFSESIPAGFVPLSESNQLPSPGSEKAEGKSSEETEVITSSEQSTEEEKAYKEKHGEPRPASTDVSLSSNEEGTDVTVNEEDAKAAPAVGTPSLYFEVKVSPKIPRYTEYSLFDLCPVNANGP